MKKNLLTYRKFDTKQSNLKSKNSSKAGNYSLSTTKILEVQNDGFKTYTFRIKKSGSNHQYFENLVVISKNGIYEFYVYQYSFDVNSKEKLPYSIAKKKIDKSTLDISSINQYLSKEQSCGTAIEIEASGEEYTCRCCGRKYIHPTCTSGYETEVLFETVVTYLGPCGGEATGGDPFNNPNDNELSDNFNCLNCNPHGTGNNGNPAVGVVTPSDQFNTFAEENLTTEQQTIINYFANRLFKGKLEFFLFDNNYSLEAENFVKEAIDAKIDNNDVDIDFENQIIIEKDFKDNECLKKIYDKLGKSPVYSSYLENFLGEKPVAHLKLKASTNLASNTNAETSAPENYVITITFNENNLNKPSLAIARTFIHEMIHAEIFRKLLSIAQHPSIQLTTPQVLELKNNFPGIYDYYMRWKWNIPTGQNPSSPQHEAMSQHYRNIIKQGMKEFDNTQTEETYEALSWVGLMGTGTFNSSTGLYSNSTVAWSNLTPSERISTINKINSFNSTNTNCQ